jgi:hypothetical protein
MSKNGYQILILQLELEIKIHCSAPSPVEY